MKSRSERVQEFLAEQAPISLATLIVGSAAVIVVLAGSLLLLVAGGLTPYQKIFDTTQSGATTMVLYTGIVLGAVAIAASFTTYKQMPTKPAREAAVSGGALGAQAILYAGIYLFLRQGENFDLFVRQNASFELLADLGGAFVNGARNTVLLAAAGEAIGIGLGLVLALLILSQRVVVRAPARAYINFFRGTPLIWQLAVGYFGIVLGVRLPLSTYQVAMLILGLNAGAYSAEVFRAGIQSVERGQMEAARSLGMSYMQAMRYAILPQAFRRVIPPLTNEFIILIKDTSLVFLLGLSPESRELFSVARDSYGDVFNATVYLGSVLGYLAVTLPLIRAVTALETKLRSGLVSVTA